MIPLVDVAMTLATKKLLQATIKDLTVVFSPEELARRAIAAAGAEEDSNLPGVSVWRLSTEKDQAMSNKVMADRGIPMQYKSDAAGLENALLGHQRRRYVIASYEINCYTKKLSDLNDIERLLTFIDVYNPLTIDIAGVELSFHLEEEAPSYAQTPNDRSEKILEFFMSKIVRVSTFWALDADYRVIHEMFIDYYDSFLDTGLVPNELLDQVHIVGSV